MSSVTCTQLRTTTPHTSPAGHSAAPPRATDRAASIVIASINRPRGITGVHTHTGSLIEGLDQFGCTAAHVSPFSGSRLWLPVFAVRPLLLNRISQTAGTLWYRHFHAAALGTNLRRHLGGTCGTAAPGCDSVDAILAQCPVSARVALDLRRKLELSARIALVAHFNHSEAEEYRQLGLLPSNRAYQRMLNFENQVLGEVDQVIYVSEWARQIVESERNIHPRRSTVIHNGIPDLTTPTTLTRKDIGLDQHDLVLINVGTLEPRKNQLNLLALFAEMQKRHTHAKLLLVGQGSDRPRIDQKIRTLNLTGKVQLLGSRADVPDLLSISDLYLHYARLENCPVVLLECARAGIPFAAVPAGGIPELQEAMDVNIPLDPENIESSLAALNPLLTSAEVRKELGGRARAAFIGRFTTDAMARAYLAALDLPIARDEHA